MDSFTKIQSDLTNIINSFGYSSPVMDALIQLIVRALYENQIFNINQVLESSFIWSQLLNSRIQHALDSNYSVPRGSNQRIIFKNLEVVKDMHIKKFDTLMSIGTYQLIYARDYEFNKEVLNGSKVEIETILCKKLINKNIEINVDNLFSNMITTSDLTEDLEISIKRSDTETIYPEITKNINYFTSNLERFNDRGLYEQYNTYNKYDLVIYNNDYYYANTYIPSGSEPPLANNSWIRYFNNQNPFLVIQTCPGYGISIININNPSTLISGDTINVRSPEYLPYNLESEIKAIPGYLFEDSKLQYEKKDYIARLEDKSLIYQNATANRVGNYVIRSNSDLKELIKSFFIDYLYDLNVVKRPFSSKSGTINFPVEYNRYRLILNIKDSLTNTYTQFYNSVFDDGDDPSTRGTLTRLYYKGLFNKTTIYNMNDCVLYNGYYYRSTIDSNTAIPTYDIEHWIQTPYNDNYLDSSSNIGNEIYTYDNSVPGLHYTGPFDESKTTDPNNFYQLYDSVLYNNKYYYLSKKMTSSNASLEPGSINYFCPWIETKNPYSVWNLIEGEYNNMDSINPVQYIMNYTTNSSGIKVFLDNEYQYKLISDFIYSDYTGDIISHITDETIDDPRIIDIIDSEGNTYQITIPPGYIITSNSSIKKDQMLAYKDNQWIDGAVSENYLLNFDIFYTEKKAIDTNIFQSFIKLIETSYFINNSQFSFYISPGTDYNLKFKVIYDYNKDVNSITEAVEGILTYYEHKVGVTIKPYEVLSEVQDIDGVLYIDAGYETLRPVELESNQHINFNREVITYESSNLKIN